ncbi:MAG: DUF885 domain-containing protein [Pseudomonadota bacterium]
MMLIRRLAMIGICAMCVSTPAMASSSEALNKLFEEYWSNEMREDPFAATRNGVSGYDDQIPKVTPQDYERRRESTQAFADQLAAIDRNALDENNALSADLLAFILKHDLSLSEFDRWRMPFLADSGFHMSFGFVVGATSFRDEQDYVDYIARLNALPEYLRQNIENMRRGMADGFTQPKEILPYILPSFEAQVKDNAAAHPHYAPFRSMPDSISSRRAAALRRQAMTVLDEKIIPNYADLAAFMRDEYMPAARDTIGAYDLPDGRAYYTALVRYYTSLDTVTPESIHRLGLDEVDRIRNEMAEVIAETGFDGTFREFIEFLRTDEQFYPKTPQDLLERAAWIAKDIDGRLPAWFGKLPRQPYSVEPVPAEIAPNYTTGRYIGAAEDADRGGQYWVNTYALDKRPFYEMTALTLHEATPGHHLQNALALEIEGAPEFRKQFYPHAFGEGWGLYAEKLGVEMGVYETPYDDFGRLSYEMWRACRLVIDTGLHAKGWTRQQALDYLAENTALSLHNVQTEVDRYIAWPGQALSYKMGELTIWELRAKAERELGEDFDIRTFHDAVLNGGGLPLDILRTRINSYIDEAKSK